MGKYALIIVSALIFSMITYSHALNNALFNSNNRTVQSFSQNQAHNIAQSSAMVAINHLRNHNDTSLFYPKSGEFTEYPYAGGFQMWDELGGSYNIWVSNQNDETYTLRATGRFEDTIYRTTVGMEAATPVWNPIIDAALHAEISAELTGNTFIAGHVTTNSISTNPSAVQLGSNTNIDSTLFIGPGGDINEVVNNPDRVKGGVYNLLKEKYFPPPIFPQFPEISLTSGSIYSTQTITPSQYEDFYIPEIYLTGGAQLTIDTQGEKRILHVGRFDIQSGNVHIIGGGSLDIYVGTTVDMGGSSSVNKNGDINDLFLFYKGVDPVDLGDEETVDFGGSTLFNGNFVSQYAKIILRGTGGIQGNVLTLGSSVHLQGNAEAISRLVYAPFAHVSMAGTARIRGAVISNTFYSQGNAQLTYDPEFDADLPIMEGQGIDFNIVYWD